MKNKSYLGDGLYIKDHGFQFELFTSNGEEVTNRVFLDDSTLLSFFNYIESTRGIKVAVEKVAIDPPTDIIATVEP